MKRSFRSNETRNRSLGLSGRRLRLRLRARSPRLRPSLHASDRLGPNLRPAIDRHQPLGRHQSRGARGARSRRRPACSAAAAARQKSRRSRARSCFRSRLQHSVQSNGLSQSGPSTARCSRLRLRLWLQEIAKSKTLLTLRRKGLLKVAFKKF